MMKLLPALVLTCVCQLCDAQGQQAAPSLLYSPLYNAYAPRFEILLVISLNGNMIPESNKRFVIIGIEKKHIKLIDRYTYLDRKDSITQKVFLKSSALIKYIKSKLIRLKSENEISKPCFHKSTIIQSRDTLTEIKDLKLNEDVVNIAIEYKLNGRRGRVQQSDPSLAMAICPDNIERKKFFDFIQYLNSYLDTPFRL